MSSAPSLGAAYFDGIFASDEDPWSLAASPYETAKFERTKDALADRRYRRALEVGCAHGVLSSKLVNLCDTLLAIDISSEALIKANKRIGDRPGVALERMAFPKETPEGPFDLVILSEVAYYWGVVDLGRAAEWLAGNLVPSGRVILVHYTGETDYPHSGEDAVNLMWAGLPDTFEREREEQHDGYRLDLWVRR